MKQVSAVGIVSGRKARSVVVMVVLSAAASLLAGCQPGPPRYIERTGRQFERSSGFSVQHNVRWKSNGQRVGVIRSSCGADNAYSGLLYTGLCTVRVVDGGRTLQVRWTYEHEPIVSPIPGSFIERHSCNYDVNQNGGVRVLPPTTNRTGCALGVTNHGYSDELPVAPA